MEGCYRLINSEHTLNCAKEELDKLFKSDKYYYLKVYSGKRTLDQNALKSIWYRDIAKHRGDVSAKDVERECKYKYGVTILRRDIKHNYIYENTIDKMPYEKRLLVMDCFAVTSVMTVKELAEYIEMMKADNPYLSGDNHEGQKRR